MAIHKPCPRCQSPLKIPQPAPEQIRCDKCGAIIKTRIANSEQQEAVTAKPLAAPTPQPQAAPGASRPNFVVLAGLVGGVLLICMLPIAGLGLAWVFSGKEKTPEKSDFPQQQVVEQKEQAEPKGPPPMSPEIRDAIDRGVAHLKKRMLEPNGTAGGDSLGGRYADSVPIGRSALVGLALLEAKVSPDDPVIQKALTDVRAAGPTLSMVYALGAVLLFLNRLHEANGLPDSDLPLIRSLALRLLAGQTSDGRWSYPQPPLSPAAEKELLKMLESNPYKPKGDGSSYIASHSMTQFALLGLWASRQQGVPIRPAVLLAAAEFHQSQDEQDGTWEYSPAFRPFAGIWGTSERLADSNTCAGLIALAMEKTLREDNAFGGPAVGDPPADPKADQRCDRAFAHLAGVIDRKGKPPISRGKVIKADAYGDYYFFWCLERTAVIYDKETIGGKDWYGWGSKVILANQNRDGSWVEVHGDICDTCFAILFLTRANLAKDLTRSFRMRGGKAAIP